MDYPSSILKSRDITLPTKVHLVKAMVFPGVMYGCESWTIKKTERWRIDAFELWCWRRLLRVPWTSRRANQAILKEISPEYSFEGLMLKLKLQYFWPPDAKNWKRRWYWERLKAGGEGDDRGWDGWMASSTQWTWVWVNSGSWWWTGRSVMLQFMGSQRVPWTERSSHSILKEINPDYSLEGLMLKLKLQYFWPPDEKLAHQKRPWYWERLRAGGEGDERGWDGWMASSTQWTWIWANSGR